MADFFARVELHGASWPTGYEKLHTAMAQHGFTNCILGTAGRSQLPTAFYHSTERIDDLNKVAEAVKACADSTGYLNEVIVMRNAGWVGYLSGKC
jgi:hypothetical protein